MTFTKEDILDTTLINDDTSNDNSLEEIINTQKQLDKELKHLKNRYSRYSQLVSYQQEEESDLKDNSILYNFNNTIDTEEKNIDFEKTLIENDEKELDNKNTNADEEQEKEMSRLCNLVQSLLSEAQDAIESKPEISLNEENEKNIDDYDLPLIPRRMDSLNVHHSEFTESNTEEIKEKSNHRYSILTDTTAVAQSSVNFDLDNDYDYSRLNNPRQNNLYYHNHNDTRNYMQNDYYYRIYGSNPGYNELNQSNMFNEMYKEDYYHSVKGGSSSSSNQHSGSVVEYTPRMKNRRRHRRHHRTSSKRIRPLDSNGEPYQNDETVCPVHSAVEKKQSKLFKTQFGSDTQLFISFFTSFFVTSILVTISCLWSVIQVMAGNVNDKNLSHLLKSSSENAILKNKKRIEEILEKEEISSNSSSDEEEDDDDDDDDENEKYNRHEGEINYKEKNLIKGKRNHREFKIISKPFDDSFSLQYYTAPTSPTTLEYGCEINKQRLEKYNNHSDYNISQSYQQDTFEKISNDCYKNKNKNENKNTQKQSTLINDNSYLLNIRRNSL